MSYYVTMCFVFTVHLTQTLQKFACAPSVNSMVKQTQQMEY